MPLIWMEWQPEAEEEYNRAMLIWQQRGAQEDKRPVHRMPANDVQLFLWLAASLKIILGRSIREADFDRAKWEMDQFLKGFLEATLLTLVFLITNRDHRTTQQR